VDYSAIPPNELILLCFQTRDESAWCEFVRRFQPLIAGVVIRVAARWEDASGQLIDDLVQETYLKLYENRGNFLESFRPTHKDAVFGYIKVLTANLVHDHFKASRSQKRGNNLTMPLDVCEGSQKLERATEYGSFSAPLDRVVLIREIESCLLTIAPGPDGERDRRIFWLYYRAGLPANAIAALPTIRLSTKGVESTLLRLNRQIRDRLVNERELIRAHEKTEKGNLSAESL
jgi:RNA polymerase sigma factor (sigma-70 family)